MNVFYPRPTNPKGTPKDKIRCEFCQVTLTDDNRSKISKVVVFLKHLIFQVCCECRNVKYGRVEDANLLKRGYSIIRVKEGKTQKERDQIWLSELDKMEEIHPGGKSLPGLGKEEQNG